MKEQKILFVKPFSTLGYAITPPLSLGYLASYLRKDGWSNIEILDCTLKQVSPEKFKEYVLEKKPDVIGVTVYSNNIKIVKEQINVAKEANPEVLVVIGGPHASAIDSKELMGYFDKIDFAFKGEGEKGLKMLLEKLFQNKDIPLSHIPGLVYRSEGEVFFNPVYFEEDLDSLPFPAWDFMPPGEYPEAPAGSFFKQLPIGYLVTSRGCPYNCTFCASKSVVGRNMRMRSADNIIEEMKWAIEKYGIKEFHIMDDNFTAHRARAVEVLEKIVANNFNISLFGANGLRLDTLDDELLKLMKKAGFYAIHVGIESGSQRIMDHMNKHIKKEMVEERIKAIRKMGFRTGGAFIIGYPEENEDDLRQTYEFSRKLMLDRAGFNFYLPLPGSEMYTWLKESGRIDGVDWDKIRFDNITVCPKGISRETLKKWHRKIFLGFWLRPRIVFNVLRDLRSPAHLKLILKRVFNYLRPTK
ncbi:MAG: hypothetical protein COU51_04045 [Parcubacteria group bacterium CG10_big_fil_rev_8_21_14_0_10_36_14]|nr:MAG: hypothetical protein COU51_04045 [Parcubacteria group bacterium CG10_big_fil_rev_8_21_14_0_10_36_14]